MKMQKYTKSNFIFVCMYLKRMVIIWVVLLHSIKAEQVKDFVLT